MMAKLKETHKLIGEFNAENFTKDSWSYRANLELVKLLDLLEKLENESFAIGAGGISGKLINAPEPLLCDICGVECADPWHFSTETTRHSHACDDCWLKLKL